MGHILTPGERVRLPARARPSPTAASGPTQRARPTGNKESCVSDKELHANSAKSRMGDRRGPVIDGYLTDRRFPRLPARDARAERNTFQRIQIDVL